jgi:hypothetical protein
MLKFDTPMALVFPVFSKASMAFQVTLASVSSSTKTPSESNGKYLLPGLKALERRISCVPDFGVGVY